ncbi:PhzF family phenazine biosynthesis protein, partial [Streptomyces cavourensis]|nr:PhzF family phenazine biosynthesis protein [Streptomyces cavourensis]
EALDVFRASRQRLWEGMTAYVRELGLTPETAVLTLHQGADMGRPGTLTVELRAGDARVRVAGTGTRIGG